MQRRAGADLVAWDTKLEHHLSGMVIERFGIAFGEAEGVSFGMGGASREGEPGAGLCWAGRC